MNRSTNEKMQKIIIVLLFSIFYGLICFLNLAVQANEDNFPEIPPSGSLLGSSARDGDAGVGGLESRKELCERQGDRHINRCICI